MSRKSKTYSSIFSETIVLLKKLGWWFVINALLPMVLPVLTIAVVNMLFHDSFPFISTAGELLFSGFYTFSSLVLIFSLWEDWGAYKRWIGFGWHTWFFVLVVLTLAIFYLTKSVESTYIQNHKPQFFVIWLLTAVSAIIAKWKILKEQYRL